MIIVLRKPGDPPLPPIGVDYGDDQSVAHPDVRSDDPSMSKKSFIPSKPVLVPLPHETLVSYGDRLLWHQLALQLNDRRSEMLTEDEYLATVHGFFPEAVERNLRAYRSYFNSRQATMGFREIEMPIPVEFVEKHDAST